MTREEIMNMPAGTEMDALVAEKVFNLTPDYEVAEYYHGRPFVKGLRDKYDENGALPFYSTYMDFGAWDVVEKLCNETGCDIVKVCKRDPELLRGDWSCNFGRGFEAFAETAPLAICRAALLAVLDD